MDNLAILPANMKIFGKDMPVPDNRDPGPGAMMKNRVPASALDRYDMFRADAAEAEAVLKAYRDRLDEAQRLGRDNEQLEAVIERKRQRAGAATAILHSMRPWMNSNTIAVTYRVANENELKAVKYSPDALDRARMEVDRIRDQISTVQTAPLPRTEFKANIMRQIDQFRQRGHLPVAPDGRINPVHPDGMLHFLAWLLPEDMWSDRIESLLPPESDRALPSAEKATRIADLRRQLVLAELLEVALVDASDGLAHYRPQMSVPSLLHLVPAVQ